MKKEALLYRKLDGGAVECHTCARLCKLREGSHGFCFVRQNIGGKLYLLNYGTLASVQIDPIEKKPFSHFMPGTRVLGLGTSSCNFGCTFCLNHNISKTTEIFGEEISPELAVDIAIRNSVQGIAYTYNEPTIFLEYALDVAREARKRGLFNVFVTNGFMTKEAVGAMKGLIDAAVVNFKGNAEHDFVTKYEIVPSNDPVKDSLLEMKKAGIYIEITDLVVPKIGDSEEACSELMSWICEQLGPDAPVHILKFHPDYKEFDLPSTPDRTMKRHYEIAKSKGLRYVYMGNVPGSQYESTYCPSCGKLAIGRSSMSVTEWNLDDKMHCKKCGYKLSIYGNVPGWIAKA